MISFSSVTGRPSPGPQTFSRRAVQCSLQRRLTAFSTTQSPGVGVVPVREEGRGEDLIHHRTGEEAPHHGLSIF